MMDSRARVADWLRNEFTREQSEGFPRLKRIPDTRVIRFLDHFADLDPAGQSALVATLVE